MASSQGMINDGEKRRMVAGCHVAGCHPIIPLGEPKKMPSLGLVKLDLNETLKVSS